MPDSLRDRGTTAGSTSDIVARVYSAAGVGGAEFVLNSTIPNVQERPALAMAPFGADFVAFGDESDLGGGSAQAVSRLWTTACSWAGRAAFRTATSVVFFRILSQP